MNSFYTIIILFYVHIVHQSQETQETINIVRDDLHVLLCKAINNTNTLFCDNCYNRTLLKNNILPFIDQSARNIAKKIAGCASNFISLLENSLETLKRQIGPEIQKVMKNTKRKIIQRIEDVYCEKKHSNIEDGSIIVDTQYDPELNIISCENMPLILESFQMSIIDFHFIFKDFLSNIETIQYKPSIKLYHKSLINSKDQVLCKIDFCEDSNYHIKILEGEKEKIMDYVKDFFKNTFMLKKNMCLEEVKQDQDVNNQPRKIEINATSYDSCKISAIREIVKSAINDESMQIIDKLKKHTALIQKLMSITLWKYYDMIEQDINEVNRKIETSLRSSSRNHAMCIV